MLKPQIGGVLTPGRSGRFAKASLLWEALYPLPLGDSRDSLGFLATDPIYPALAGWLDPT